VSLLRAHMVFVTKYRRPVFTGAMLTFCEQTIRSVCAESDVEMTEFNGEADRVHMLVASRPTLAISALVQRLKAAPPTRCIASTPTAKHAPSKCRGTPGDKQDGLTPDQGPRLAPKKAPVISGDSSVEQTKEARSGDCRGTPRGRP
jgi:REP element-mobilizing transposase RayT